MVFITVLNEQEGPQTSMLTPYSVPPPVSSAERTTEAPGKIDSSKSVYDRNQTYGNILYIIITVVLNSCMYINNKAL